MSIEEYGYERIKAEVEKRMNLSEFTLGRVVEEHKERYRVRTEEAEVSAEITGKLRYTAKNREDFPAVGDWVLLSVLDPEFSVIHEILPRFSMITRQAVGKTTERQVIAANIDYAFLMQAVDRDFNINRLERYLSICYSGKVEPTIVLTKTDLIETESLAEIETQIRQRIKNVPLVAISNETREGYDRIYSLIEKGNTYCMLGSSGVGKSTLMNKLSGRDRMKTGEISNSTSKGRHVTSHRELVVLESGGILIDNPGMREVGVSDTSGGVETTFQQIESRAEECKYKDCRHVSEDGCVVLEALEKGEIDRNSYENYLKIERETTHFEMSLAEKRKKDKDFGKMIKNFKKDVKKVNSKRK